LDVRAVVDTTDDLTALIDENGAYEGMIVYAKDTQLLYVLQNSKWVGVTEAVDNNISNLQEQVNDNASEIETLATKQAMDLETLVEKSRKINDYTLDQDITLTYLDVEAVPASDKGTANGIAELDAAGKVPSSQLPSYVDDVVEGYISNDKIYSDSAHTTEIDGETGKIYVDLDTNKTYRWSGSTLVEISESLALGETSSTAFRGDYGKIAYDKAHTHDNKTVLDAIGGTATGMSFPGSIEATEFTVIYGDESKGITMDDVNSWNNAVTYAGEAAHDIGTMSSLTTTETATLVGAINEVAASAHTHSNKSVLDATTASYTTAEKIKLDGIEEGANKTIVDSELLDESSNPVENQVITAKINDLTTSVNALAASIGVLNSWAAISKLTDAGEASKAFSIGDQLAEDWSDVRSSGTTAYTDVPMNVVHFSNSETMQTGTDTDGAVVTADTKGMFLQWAYCTPFDMPFDAREAMYDVPEGGMSAGTYYFKLVCTASSWKAYACNGKYYSFTLENDLTEGEQLYLVGNQDTSDFAGTNIQVFASPTTFTATETVALTEVTEDTATGTYLGATDGTGDVNHYQRMFLGYNRYKYSALRQWLNSSAEVGEWWTKQNKWDRAPSQLNTYAGFLAGYSEDFIAAMKPIKVQHSTNTVTDSGVTDVMYDKVFLPSLEQMYITPQISGIEGEAWDFYKQLAAANGRTGKYAQWQTYAELKSYALNAKTSSCYVRLRSAYRGYACITWGIVATGGIYSSSATYAWRARPACFV